MKNVLTIATALVATAFCTLVAFALFLGSIWLSYILVAATIIVAVFLFVRSAILFKLNPPESD